MKRHFIKITFILLVFLSHLASANTSANNSIDDFELKVIATSTGSSIIVRWAPVNFDTWHWGNTNGYELTRFTLEENGQQLTINQQAASKIVLGADLKPLPEADWEPLVNANDAAGIAAGAIHGTGFAVENLSSTDAVSVYNVQKENENRFGLSLFAADQSLVIAEAMGIAFEDNTVATGNKYLYRVVLKNVPSTSSPAVGVVSIGVDDVESFAAPANLAATSGDMVVQLSWDYETEGTSYTSYDVERSSNGGTTFSKINALPVIYTTPQGTTSDQVFYVDSLGANNQEYIYRVKGKTSFGTLSAPSETVSVTGKPTPISEIAHISTIIEDQSGDLVLDWRFEANMENQIQGFNVYRSGTREGAYTKLNTNMLSNTTRTYTDANSESSAYYVIKVVDLNDYEVASFPSLGQLKDITPPASPVGLTGSCSEAGLVTLSWDENTEPDLMGYRVFISNDGLGVFQQVTEKWISQNQYQKQIQIKTLSKDIYFKVLAVDNRENFSEMSKPVKIGRPDIVPPVMPVFTTVISRPSGVDLEWIPSSSDDVANHVLQRRSEVDQGWEDLLSIAQGEAIKSFTDQTALTKYDYSYRVLAYDDGGNVSSSKIVFAKPIDTGIRGEIVNIGISGTSGNDDEVTNPYSFTKDESSVTLYWSYPDMEGLYDFQIYKKINGGAMHTFKVIKAREAAANVELSSSGNVTSFQFMDLEIQSGSSGNGTGHDAGSGSGDTKNTSSGDTKGGAAPTGVYSYTYVIQARYIDGGSSPLSNSVSISF